MHPNTQTRNIIRMVVRNRKVVNRNRLIQYNELDLVNRQIASVCLLEFVAYLKFISEDPSFTLDPKGWLSVVSMI